MVQKELGPQHKILKLPPLYHQTTTKIYQVNAHPFAYSIGVHANCICNEYLSLTNRHLVDRTYIGFDRTLWLKIARQTRKYYPTGLRPVSYQDVIDAYQGQKKRAYTHARENLTTMGYEPQMARVRMFVKPDRYPYEDCIEKDPRAIQYRSLEFNLELGRYIKPFEHYIYENLHYGVVSNTRVIAKGLNQYERAELLIAKADHFREPRYLLVDHSRFDSTINIDHLRTTHRKYQKAFNSKRLQKLLNAQKRNVGWTKGGIKYMAYATRMSGDPDTGCGNSVINADCIWGFLRESGILKYDFLIDGDDSVIIVEREHVQGLDWGIFAKLGFDTKHEVVDCIEQAEFCQSRVVYAQRPVFVRNPLRAMSHSLASRKQYGYKTWDRWLTAVGMSELAANQGIPVMQPYAQQLSKLAPVGFFDDQLSYLARTLKPTRTTIPIHETTRVSFERAWGISPAMQRVIENHDFTSNTFSAIRIARTKHRALQVIDSIQKIHNTLLGVRFKPWWSD